MECNKEDAKKAMDIAEKKLTENDYDGAKKFVNKAQNLYPELDGLKQVLMMVNVYISASNGGDSDWYRVLGVDPLADDVAVKKQYRKLALLLHPDKNKFNGAEGAFKLVSEAWCLLSDKVKRIAYDQKRKSKEVKPKKTRRQPKQPQNQQRQPPNPQAKPPPNRQQKQPPKRQQKPPSQQKQPNPQQQQPNPQKQPPSPQKQPPNLQKQQPPNLQKQQPNPQQQQPNPQQQQPSPQKQPPNLQKQQPSQQKQQPSPQKQPPNQPSSSGPGNGRARSNKRASEKQKKVGTFWTMCNKCNSEYEYVRAFYLNKTLRCRNCHLDFVATEKKKTPIEEEKTPQATTNKDANVSSFGRGSSVTDSADYNFQKDSSISRMENSNCGNVANQAEEKRVEESQERDDEDAARGIANSDLKVEERVFKKLRTDDYAGVSCGIKV